MPPANTPADSRSFFGLGVSKLFFAIPALLVITISGILSKQPAYEIVISIFSMVTLVYLIEGRVAGSVCGIFYSASSAIVCLTRQLYGLMLFNLLISVPFYIASCSTWKKHRQGKNVIPKKLPPLGLAIAITSAAVGFFGVYFMLRVLGSSSLIFDSLALTFAIPGMVLMFLRYKQQWYFNLCANLTMLLLWFFKTHENIANLNFLLSSALFSISSVIGFVSWHKREKALARHSQI